MNDDEKKNLTTNNKNKEKLILKTLKKTQPNGT